MSDDKYLPAMPYKTLDIPETLVVEMAKGLVEPKELAEAYGFSGELWDRLQAYEPFLRAVTLMRQKLEQEGFTFRMQNAMMADMLGKEVFRQVMQPDVSLGQKLEVYKTFTRYADLEPKPGIVGGGAGAGTSINIILGQGKTIALGGPVEAPIEVEAVEKPKVEFSIPLPEFLQHEPVTTLQLDV